MKVLILYRPNSEHSRSIEEFMHSMTSRYSDIKVEMMSLDTREGMATATIYDVVAYPAILVMRIDGSVQNMWEGETLPLIDEVAGYAQV